MSGVSVAFYMAADVIAKTVGQTPLPAGLTTVEVGDWILTINNGREPAVHDSHELGAFEVFAKSTRYLAFASFNPFGGMIGGMPEAQFIEDLEKLGAERPEEGGEA